MGNLKITAIQQNTETGAGVEASIRIPPNTLPIGISVGVQIETSKKMYSGCIPLEALHQEEGNQYYVYTTDEKKTILGTEVIARRVVVMVLCQEKVQIKYNQFSLCLAKLNLLFLSHFLLDFSDILPHIGLGINTRNGCEYVLYCKMFLCIQKSTYMHVYN